MIVTLVRHGDVDGRPHVFRGTSDPALSPQGWQQLHARTAALTVPHIARVVTSPLLRCRAFGESLALEHDASLVIDADLRELGFGAWEDRTPEEVAATDAATLTAFRADPSSATPHGGERYADFVDRVCAAFTRVAAARAGHVVIVTHAGVMRTLIAHWLQIPPTRLSRIALGPAASCRVSLAGTVAARDDVPIVLSIDSGISCVD